MTTATEVTNDMQDKVLDTVRVGQKAVVDFVRSWSQTVESTFAKFPELTFSEPPKPSELFESTVTFTEKLLAAQRDFASQVFEAAIPATRAAPAAAQAARAAAPKV